MQHVLMNAYRTLREGHGLSDVACRELLAQGALPHQLASLCVRLIERDELAPHEADVIAHAVRQAPPIGAYLAAAWPDRHVPGASTASIDLRLADLLRETHAASTLGVERIAGLVERFTHDRLPLEFMAMWLMTVCTRGLSVDDTRHLALAMRDSGRTYDYRNLPELGGAKVIRRYPTGALSEKAALILPSLLASVRDRFPIVSPFLVARSLGHTGGTWDKLKAIPGFEFPAPGDASVAAMRACGVAMTVTHGDVCPADRKMYAFRSTTGTIECHPLLLSSIGSKQLALPADHLLMDVRYGSGAFCETREAGERLGADLVALLAEEGLACSYDLTDTVQPNGSAVGNALEVLEAIAVMTPGSDAGWDVRALGEQRELVLRFFALLLSRTFPEVGYDGAVALGRSRFADGSVLRAFLDVLAAHGVSEDTRARLAADAAAVVAPQGDPVPVRAQRGGVLRRIDQHQLGFVVNFAFGGGGNEYGVSFDPRAGVLLRKRIGDAVGEGEVLCAAWVGEQGAGVAHRVADDLRACFEVG